MSQESRTPTLAEVNTLLGRFSIQSYTSLAPSVKLLSSMRLEHAAKPASLPTQSQSHPHSQEHLDNQLANSLLLQERLHKSRA